MLKQQTMRRVLVASCVIAVGLLASCGELQPAAPANVALVGIDAPGLTNGPRAATYDPQRDLLWIMSRVAGSDPNGVVVLSRLDVTSGSVTPTALQLSGEGYISGTVTIDQHGVVWLGWGQTLAQYDPVSGATHVFHVPVTEGTITGVSDPGLAGRMVAMTIDPAGEIWIAVYGATQLYGFDELTTTFDRTLAISVSPFDETRLWITNGQLLVNGLDRRANPLRAALEMVDRLTGRETSVGVDAMDFALSGSQSFVYVDGSGHLGKGAVDGTSIQSVGPSAPVAPSSRLTTDAAGNIWFSMLGRNLVGLGEVTSAGAVEEYPLPQQAGTGGADPACPPQNAQMCVEGHAVFNPEIQAIQVDRHGNVWVVTRVSGSGDPASVGGMKPIYELPSAA